MIDSLGRRVAIDFETHKVDQLTEDLLFLAGHGVGLVPALRRCGITTRTGLNAAEKQLDRRGRKDVFAALRANDQRQREGALTA